MISDDPKSFKIRFEDSPTKVSFSPSGVWGGPNLQGQIVAHFYVEGHAFPLDAKIRVDPRANSVIEQISPEEPILVRQIQATVVLSNPFTAIAIGNWLIQHGTSLAKQMEGKVPVAVVGQPNPPLPK